MTNVIRPCTLASVRSLREVHAHVEEWFPAKKLKHGERAGMTKGWRIGGMGA